MLSKKEFKNLLSNPESSILDFKRDFYHFNNEKNLKTTSAFIKDVVSFSNTIRYKTSYIIFGIDKLENGKNDLIGIKNIVDDAILQDKVKDKVYPRPVFLFYAYEFESKNYGILEFPITKYESPIKPSIKGLKGLEVGKTYIRRGSSNAEANTDEIIKLNDWFRSLSTINVESNIKLKTSNFIKRLSDYNEKLSFILIELKTFSESNNLKKVRKFCKNELIDISSEKDIKFEYRTFKAICSTRKVAFNNQYSPKMSKGEAKLKLESQEHFTKKNFTIRLPIFQIERHYEELKTSKILGMSIFILDVREVFGEQANSFLYKNENPDIYFYLFEDDWINLLSQIRQKGIELLSNI